MITVFKKTHKASQSLSLKKREKLVWIYVQNPNHEELKRLVEFYDLDIGHLNDALDPNEVPRLEKEGASLYIFTRIPKETDNGTYITTPVLLILLKQAVIVIAKGQEEFFGRFIERPWTFITAKPITVFISLFAEITSIYHGTIMKLNKKIGTLSNKTDEIKNTDIIQFVVYETILNELLNAIIQTNLILQSFSTIKGLVTTRVEKDLVEDIFLSTGQLIELTKSSLTKVKNIRDAYSTILTNNLNRVIRFFTVLTIVLTVPMIVTSLYGMNVSLPFSESGGAFPIIVSSTLFICTVLVILFHKKNWL
jgi:magnesium transporter